MKSNLHIFYFLLLVTVISMSFCSSGSDDIEALKDRVNSQNPEELAARAEPGTQQAFVQGSTSAPFGFHLYLPPEHDISSSAEFPLLIHLHGGGARGNSAQNPGDLSKILFDGPPKLILSGLWTPTNPMIVVSPQSPGIWNTDHLHQFIAYLIDQLKVDVSRIYMTGFSMGGKGCYDYISSKGDDAYTAAIVPIAGWGSTSTGDQFKNIAVWAFHGNMDQVIAFNSSLVMIDAINKANPQIPAKLTMYPGVNHDSWTRTYDGSGIGQGSTEYDPFDQDIYDWMYLFEKRD